MTEIDLGFMFVIAFVGLLCSVLCAATEGKLGHHEPIVVREIYIPAPAYRPKFDLSKTAFVKVNESVLAAAADAARKARIIPVVKRVTFDMVVRALLRKLLKAILGRKRKNNRAMNKVIVRQQQMISVEVAESVRIFVENQRIKPVNPEPPRRIKPEAPKEEVREKRRIPEVPLVVIRGGRAYDLKGTELTSFDEIDSVLVSNGNF